MMNTIDDDDQMMNDDSNISQKSNFPIYIIYNCIFVCLYQLLYNNIQGI